MKRKILVLIAVMSIMVAVSPLKILTAPNDPEIIITSGEVKAGNMLPVTVSLSVNPKVTTFSFILKYDPSRLSVESYDWGYSVNDVPSYIKDLTHDYADGKIYVSFMSLSILPNVEELIKVTFTANNLNTDDQTVVSILYEGVYTGFPIGASVMQYLPSTGSGIILITATTQTGSVTGKVYTFNPGIPTTVILSQKGEEKYKTIIEETTGYGQVTQEFTFNDVTPGAYDLIITKMTHLNFTLSNLIVLPGGLDLTKDADPNIRLIILPCGDLNGDGYINSTDLSIIILPANYDKNHIVYPYK